MGESFGVVPPPVGRCMRDIWKSMGVLFSRSMRPLILALAAGLSLTACAASKTARRPGPPPKAPWVVYPEAEIAEVKNAHEYKGAALCQRCHASPDGKLVKQEPELCYDCHTTTRMTHMGKVQSPPPPTLPYEAGGRIVCHTCHEVHDVKGQKFGFRMKYRDECLECHKGH